MSKVRFFCNRSFTWFLNYFFAKFLEILTAGSSEISKFLQKQFFQQLRMRCILLGSFGNEEKAEKCWVLCVVTFSNITL